MKAHMKIEQATLKKINLYNAKNPKEACLMTHFQTSPASFQNSPGFIFPKKDEGVIKKKFADIIGTDRFNEDKISFDCSYITARGMIWGLVNPLGQIFSIHSIYWNDDRPLNSLEVEIKKEFSKFESDYPNMENKITNEDKINAIVAIYILETEDKYHHIFATIKRHYQSLLLKICLEDSLTEKNNTKKISKV